MTTDRIFAALIATAVLSGCGQGETAAPVRASVPKAAPQPAATKPVQAAPAPEERKAPAFDYVGLWIDSRDCPPTDHYMELARDGAARFFGSDGRWSRAETGLRFIMPRQEILGAPGEYEDGWSAVIQTRPVSRNEILIHPDTSRELRLYRCQ